MKGLFRIGPHRRSIMVSMNVISSIILIYCIHRDIRLGDYLWVSAEILCLFVGIAYILFADRRSV